MRKVGLRATGATIALLLATGLSACGSKKQSEAVSTALQSPGVRTVVIPKQHADLTMQQRRLLRELRG